MSAQFAFVQTPCPLLSLSLGATSSSWDRPSSLSLSRTRSFFPPSSSLQSGLHGRARMTPPRTERPITSHISSYSACLPRTRVMRFAALMKDPLFIDKQRPRSATFRPMSCSRGEEWGDPPRNNFARDTNCLPTDPCTC